VVEAQNPQPANSKPLRIITSRDNKLKLHQISVNENLCIFPFIIMLREEVTD